VTPELNPFSGRARRDIAFCALTLPLILPGPVAGFAVTIALAQADSVTWSRPVRWRSMTPPRGCGGWSATCTTARRSGWPRWP
jgi:hypothetical protein